MGARHTNADIVTSISRGRQPDFKVAQEAIEKEAERAAKMWIAHPAYKMTLSTMQSEVDVNNGACA